MYDVEKIVKAISKNMVKTLLQYYGAIPAEQRQKAI